MALVELTVNNRIQEILKIFFRKKDLLNKNSIVIIYINFYILKIKKIKEKYLAGSISLTFKLAKTRDTLNKEIITTKRNTKLKIK